MKSWNELSANLTAFVQAEFPFADWNVELSGRMIILSGIVEDKAGSFSGRWYRNRKQEDIDGSARSVIEWARNALEDRSNPLGQAHAAHLAQQEADALASWIPAAGSKKKDSRL